MSYRFIAVETSLNRAEFRWKWLRFLRRTFVLGAVICALLLLFAAAVLSDRVCSKSLALAFFLVVGVFGVLVWVVLGVLTLAASPERSRLAAALERVDRRLLDRLNTLLFLERHGNDGASQSFSLRIAKQAGAVLAADAPRAAFPGSGPWWQLLVFAVMLSATWGVYRNCSPWRYLLAHQKPAVPSSAHPDRPLELALPTNNVEQNSAWGEVRITDPGSDLKVTKVDVVPLQIEAAANRSLQKVAWASAINGSAEILHPLPAPTEPRYAVYQPVLYLDELQLSDWDVMTYYAKASTELNDAYASEVYFLEVRPFREDILKMPGGEGGKAYQTLSELSALIGAQQRVIRQTHQHLSHPPEQESLRAQDREKLGLAENDLGDSARHLYAEMAAKMENQPIGEALDDLAKAEQSLARAGQQLQANAMDDGQNSERAALTELVATRKMFQKAVSDHPRDFEDPKDEAPSPVADSARKLSQMAEFRNETKAAQDFVQKTVIEQQSLERQSRGASSQQQSRLGEKEEQLRQSLSDFQGQHPEAFKNTLGEAEQAQEAMRQAGNSLKRHGSDAAGAARRATGQVEQLQQAIDQQALAGELAHAYRLKEMLDQQSKALDKRAQGDSSMSDSSLQEAVNAARETVSQLEKTALQEPTRDAFGPQLRSALSGANKVELEASLDRVQQAEDEAEKRARSSEARDRLKQVSQAFGESLPRSLQTAHRSDPLKAGGQDSFAEAMAQLNSLQAQSRRQASAEDRQKLANQALANLRTGMRERYGSDEHAADIVARLEQTLKADRPLDAENLKRLLEELQRFSVETSDQLALKQDKPDVSNIDPTRLPPAYRGRIQKYFQKLSEK